MRGIGKERKREGKRDRKCKKKREGNRVRGTGKERKREGEREEE